MKRVFEVKKNNETEGLIDTAFFEFLCEALLGSEKKGEVKRNAYNMPLYKDNFRIEIIIKKKEVSNDKKRT